MRAGLPSSLWRADDTTQRAEKLAFQGDMVGKRDRQIPVFLPCPDPSPVLFPSANLPGTCHSLSEHAGHRCVSSQPFRELARAGSAPRPCCAFSLPLPSLFSSPWACTFQIRYPCLNPFFRLCFLGDAKTHVKGRTQVLS